ncbi:MAG: DUF2254 domain-containing protein [Nitrososphaerota archaeon]
MTPHHLRRDRQTFDMRRSLLRLWAVQNRVREGFFFIPACFIVGALLTAALLLALDDAARVHLATLGIVLNTTVASARAVLGVIAGAIITVAGLVFSITIVALQLIASQYSPRVLSSFLHDPFPQAVMGFMVGTFTYCLVVLRAVRGPLTLGGEAVVPSVSLAGAVLLAIVAALLLLAYIDYAAGAFQVEDVVRRISRETLATIARVCPDLDGEHPQNPDQNTGDGATPNPTAGNDRLAKSSYHIDADVTGWVQRIDTEAALRVLPPESLLVLETRIGDFLVAGTPLGTLWLPSDIDPAELDRIKQQVRQAILSGREQSLQHDIAFGLQLLSDIALRALSPGVNDPKTAVGVIMHLRPVLRELLLRRLPPCSNSAAEGRRLERPRERSYADYIEPAIAPIRLAGAGQPQIATALLETLGLLRREAERHGHAARGEALIAQAELLVAGYRDTGPLPADLQRVLAAAHAAGFMSVAEHGGGSPGEPTTGVGKERRE